MCMSAISVSPTDQTCVAVGGRRSAQGAICSKAAAARSTSASAWRPPTICMPIGRPAAVKPAGTEIAGKPGHRDGVGQQHRVDGVRDRLAVDLRRDTSGRAGRRRWGRRGHQQIVLAEERRHALDVARVLVPGAAPPRGRSARGAASGTRAGTGCPPRRRGRADPASRPPCPSARNAAIIGRISPISGCGRLDDAAELARSAGRPPRRSARPPDRRGRSRGPGSRRLRRPDDRRPRPHRSKTAARLVQRDRHPLVGPAITDSISAVSRTVRAIGPRR